jgi:hypothetical protein
MTTQLATRPNILKKDADGQWYSLPEVEVDSFIHASEAVELADFMSSDWHSAKDELSHRFGSYRRDDL